MYLVRCYITKTSGKVLQDKTQHFTTQTDLERVILCRL